MKAQRRIERFQRLTRRALLASAPCGALLFSADTDDDTVWNEYLTWLKGRALGDLVGLETYRKVLAGQGVPKAEVDRRMELIAARALTRPEAMRLWFNSMYGPQGAVGPDWPTPLLVQVIKDVKPGASLDVCMGEGRNSIFLAKMGWAATGFDVSDTAVRNALARAKKVGVEFKAVRSGYQTFDFGLEKWDLIVMTYAYFPIHDAKYVHRLIESLRPAGLLAFQHGVLKKDIPRSKGDDPSLLGIPMEGELKEIFHALRILRYEEVEERSDWQVDHSDRRGRTVKMVAQKT